MKDTELQALLPQVIAGDQEAFEAVYAYTRQDVYRTVAFLVVDPQDTQDIVNEVYIRLWKSAATYNPSVSPFRYWLHGLIVRTVQDWKRNVWRRLRLLAKKRETEVEDPAEHADVGVLQTEMREELQTALGRLSYKLRVVILLRYYHHYALEEIAALLQIPLGTVKSRHHLALKELRKHYAHPVQGEVDRPYVY